MVGNGEEEMSISSFGPAYISHASMRLAHLLPSLNRFSCSSYFEMPARGAMADPVPAYMGEEADEDFLKLADVVFVINDGGTKKELLVHSQIISRQCKMLSPLLALAAEGSLEPPPAERSEVLGVTSRDKLRIEEPLTGYSEEAVVILLTFLYTHQSTAGASELKAAVSDEEWPLLRELVRLADQLNAARVLSTVEAALLECLPAQAVDVETWLPLLVLADAHSQQLPQLHRQLLAVAATAAVASLDTSAGRAKPLQDFLANVHSSELSNETLLSIMASMAAGARAVQRQSSSRTAYAAWKSEEPLVISSVPIRGSYTWKYKPDLSLASKIRQDSPAFKIGGAIWQLFAYPNGNDDASYLAAYVRGQPERFAVDVYRLVEFTISIPSTHSSVQPKSANATEQAFGAMGRGFSTLITLEELRDPAKGYLVDGEMTIQVEITVKKVLDM